MDELLEIVRTLPFMLGVITGCLLIGQFLRGFHSHD